MIISEYRVAVLQAVDNIDCYEYKSTSTNDEDVRIKNAREMWADSSVFPKYEQAENLATRLEGEQGYTEYGVCLITVNREF